MRVWNLIKWLIISLFIGILCAVGILYLLASRVPADYKPARLTNEQTRQYAKELVNRYLNEFADQAGQLKPFAWSITQKQMNNYLASMDEIAFLAGRDRGELYKSMDRGDFGFTEPAAAMDDGVLTLMVRTRDYGKILSVGLSLTVTDDQKLKVELVHARIGIVPLPVALVRPLLREQKGQLFGSDEDDSGGNSAGSITKGLGAVMAAIDEEPIPVVFQAKPSMQWVRLADITIDDGVMKLHVVPASKPKDD